MSGIHREIKKEMKFDTLSDFHKIIKRTGRDCTVQRESVWRLDPSKQSDYMTAIAQGYSETTIFHLVNLPESIEELRPVANSSGNQNDISFVDHMQKFVDQGNTWIHIDGGNRSDTILDWYANLIPLCAGDYFVTIDGELTRFSIPNSTEFTYDRVLETYPALAQHIDNQPFVYLEYVGLNREERKELFFRLNNNDNISENEMRNTSTTDYCQWIRDLNSKYKEEFVLQMKGMKKTEAFITQDNAVRYKFCAFLASLSNYYTYQNQGSGRDAFTPSALNEDYTNSEIVEKNYPKFKSLFEGVYLPLIRHLGDRNHEAISFSRNCIVDLWCLLVDLTKDGYDLRRLDKSNKFDFDALLSEYKVMFENRSKNKEPIYNTSNGSYAWFDLHRANSGYKLNHRVAAMHEDLIPVLVEKGVVIKKDKKRSFPESFRLPLWSRQGGICPLTGQEMTRKDALDGNITHMDHIEAHSKGGETTMENAQLVFKIANLQKGAA